MIFVLKNIRNINSTSVIIRGLYFNRILR